MMEALSVQARPTQVIEAGGEFLPAANNPAVRAPSFIPGAELTSPHPRPLAELEAQITELAGHLNAANHRWLMLIAEFDRREGWSDGATRSCAHWLKA